MSNLFPAWSGWHTIAGFCGIVAVVAPKLETMFPGTVANVVSMVAQVAGLVAGFVAMFAPSALAAKEPEVPAK